MSPTVDDPKAVMKASWGAAAAGLMFAAGQQPAKAQAVAVPRPATLPPKLVGTRIVIAVEPRTGLSNLPLTVAEQRNFFREEGLDVELREFADLGQAMAAVQAKAAHAMCVPFAQLLTPSAREMNWQSFVVQGRAPQVVLGVSQKTVPGFRGAGDLRGRRVGLRAKDPLAQRVLTAFLQREELVAEVDEGRRFGPAPKIEIEQTAVEAQGLVDVEHDDLAARKLHHEIADRGDGDGLRNETHVCRGQIRVPFGHFRGGLVRQAIQEVVSLDAQPFAS